jgi:phospholipid/cholesterol/gamma-HCH transport system ATP-binding protein
MDSILLNIENVSKNFDENQVLKNVSVNVYEGENLVVFGRSGTGKSVLLKLIVKLLEPNSGNIFYRNKNLNSLSAKEIAQIRKQIGFLFQSGALYDSMSVRENLSFPLKKIFNLSEKEIIEKINKTLELVGLVSAIDKMPAELSGGMRKRIALARTIITEPEIILYDEPTTGLDPITSKEISELILSLQHQLKMTSVVVTHDLICAEIIDDLVIFLKDGEIYKEGLFDEIKQSNDLFIRNFFSAKILKDVGESDV